MHLSNLSQVLSRHEQLLESKSPLLINMPDDQLASHLQQLSPASQISFFDTNYELHLAHQKIAQTHAVFSAHYQTEKVHDLVIMSFPKSKNELQFTFAMLAHCTNTDSKLLIVGENKSGIKSIEKLAKNQTSFCEKIDSARHCILFEAALNNQQQAFNLDDWFHYYTVNLANTEVKVAALPGVFSQAKLDVGTAVLLENLPQDITGKVLDFGCGAGVIACFIGLINKNATLHLADVSALALASSQKSLALNNLIGTTIATNSLSHISEQYQHVISNPPFHQGVKTHYAATEYFLANIKKHMNKHAMLTIVANSFLKYQSIIEQAIGKTEKLSVKQGFTVYQARNKNNA